MSEKERKEKLKVCYDACGNDDVCITNCKTALGGDGEVAEDGEEECD